MDTASIVTLSLVAVVLVAIYRLISYKQKYFERINVPHLKPVFLFGNQLPTLLKKRSMFDQIRWLYKQFPGAKYFGTYEFTNPQIFIKDVELIKDITVKNFDNFTDHFAVTSDFDPLFSKNLFSLRGQTWREYRAVLSPSFTGTKLKSMFILINNCALNLREFLLSETKRGVPIDTKDLFTRYTNDVIASAAFGITVNSFKDRDNEFFKVGKEATTFTFWQIFKFLLARSVPIVAKVFELKVVKPKISNYFISIVKSNVEQREKHGITRPDMIQLMIQARDDPNNGVKMDVIDMTAQAFIFFAAGFDTISTAMCFTAHLIAAHPQVQGKLLRELEQRYEAICDESNGYEALKDFHYLDAVVNEALRMYPPNPINDRMCTKRFELPPAVPGGKPFVVEPGTMIGLPVVGVHYDERYYEEPEKFKPERFLDSDGKLTIKVTDSQFFLPFGSGPRICIAHRFAMLEIKLVIAHLLALTHLSPSDKTPSPIIPTTRTFQLMPDNGFWLNLELRDKSVIKN